MVHVQVKIAFLISAVTYTVYTIKFNDKWSNHFRGLGSYHNAGHLILYYWKIKEVRQAVKEREKLPQCLVFGVEK